MIVIVDYGLGNLKSIGNALERLETPFRISSSPSMMKKAKALILPGVGAAGEGMKNLKRLKLDKVLIEEIKNDKSILGICLGMQLLFEDSEEGNTKCLGILKGKVKKFKKMRKVPQIGWNQMKFSIFNFQFSKNIDGLLQGVSNGSYFYFINSYYCIPKDKQVIVGTSEYGEEFASMIVKDNIVATQFHPEKSGRIGFQFLKNWKGLLC